jgi:hypothetical protein
VNLMLLQIVAHFRATTPGATVELVAPNGGIAGTSVVGTQDTQVTLGPFNIPQGKTTYTLRVTPSAKMKLGAVLLQPIGDFSTSLADEK